MSCRIHNFKFVSTTQLHHIYLNKFYFVEIHLIKLHENSCLKHLILYTFVVEMNNNNHDFICTQKNILHMFTRNEKLTKCDWTINRAYCALIAKDTCRQIETMNKKSTEYSETPVLREVLLEKVFPFAEESGMTLYSSYYGTFAHLICLA